MAKQKLYRYNAIVDLPNTLEKKNYKLGDYADVRGKWNEIVFKNEQPIVLELACGAGDYSIALAQRYSQKNYIAMDIKGDRLYKGAKFAFDHDINNVRFFRASIDHITNYFAEGEVSEIWITFPDPYLSETKKKKRLTHDKFLNFYREILKPESYINLKTDSQELYLFTKETIAENDLIIKEDVSDIYAEKHIPDLTDIQTYYEKMHLRDGRKITYLRFRFPN